MIILTIDYGYKNIRIEITVWRKSKNVSRENVKQVLLVGVREKVLPLTHILTGRFCKMAVAGPVAGRIRQRVHLFFCRVFGDRCAEGDAVLGGLNQIGHVVSGSLPESATLGMTSETDERCLVLGVVAQRLRSGGSSASFLSVGVMLVACWFTSCRGFCFGEESALEGLVTCVDKNIISVLPA